MLESVEVGVSIEGSWDKGMSLLLQFDEVEIYEESIIILWGQWADGFGSGGVDFVGTIGITQRKDFEMRQMTTGWMVRSKAGAGGVGARLCIVWMMDATHTGLSPVLSIFGVSTLWPICDLSYGVSRSVS